MDRAQLLVVAGTFGAVSGGAEISLASLLQLLSSEWDITVLSCNFENQWVGRSTGGVSSVSVPYEYLDRECRRLTADLAPRLLYTVMLGSDCAMRVGKEMGIPTVVNVCKVPVGPRYLTTSAPTRVTAVSNYVRDYLATKHGVESVVIPPIVRRTETALGTKRRYLTMFNPVEVKGGPLFRTIAESLPEHEFAWVPGWTMLRASSGEFDVRVCAAISRSIDIQFSGNAPRQTILEMANVVRLEPVFPPGPVFEKTRVLLVPSQWDEAFGRVAVEAMLVGIPVLGSDVGGLAEIVRTGGVALPRNDPAAWIEEIKRLDSGDHYELVQGRGAQLARQWEARDHGDVLAFFREFS